ncbi:DsbA family oxidoreductase [Clostridium beijerinckii]|uniref:DsbA family oxidoreductase n=1 Tax=Clostridium beijerinckii TaxID=1520 RepID=UPI00098C13B0|nr:DsbA family oxidoreductase [Clostridium beijerinckii]MBA8935123.1 putative DsbA family dithiol-disulfide isomerase [Clostridium beijerinckii]NOW03825.1 putative DsbA family dithiol-disulfide isomerase [Clostridium beijerinckii]NRT34762.1 putative DsbA family dithiol-disulfide isomerase [Clostridium beijerinckii]NRT45809.1 putative DsbA family dithiol-disulfide isomerase [Clostridium beijerinckii]NRU39520.1 putative DsbA family dithiol-disulfide isomerase [Clostridium beijerinckii]
MKVEIWSDFVCPFCYMGERKFEKALELFEHKDEVEIVFKSFQLNMDQAEVKDKDIHQVIADKYNISYEQAKANNDRIVKAAQEVGLNYRFDILKLNNTELAHQISKYAEYNDKGKELVDRYFKAYFEEGFDIGNKEKLIELAEEIGLNVIELKKRLDDGSLKAEIEKDKALARELDISGVPFFVINDKYAVSGAQEPEEFLKVLKKASNYN